MTTPQGRKRIAISLRKKQEILSMIDAGEKSKTEIATYFGIAKSTLSTILYSRKEITKALADGIHPSSSKRLRFANLSDVEDLLIEWFAHTRASNIPLSGPIIKEKAEEIASELGIKDFKVSNGWLWRFLRRHNICSVVMCGEASKVDENQVRNWVKDFAENTLSKFSKRDRYNMDETGVFYNLLPERTLNFKGKRCHGGTKSKERLTVALCTNADGSDKRTPLVIGRYKSPRCFKNISAYNLPCKYVSNQNAWMTSGIFRDWLLKFQQSMAKEKRKVLLTLDRCAAHKTADLHLPNVTVVFLPPNTTSHLQPLDQGIIANMKKMYRCRLVKCAIRSLEANGIATKWNVLQAIQNITVAWDLTTPTVIEKCFNKAWRLNDDSVDICTDLDIEDLDFWQEYATHVPNTCVNLEDFFSVDNDVAVSAVPVIESSSTQDEPALSISSSENDSNGEEDENLNPPTKQEVANALAVLDNFAATQGVSQKFIQCVEKIANECSTILGSYKKQTAITDFFGKTP